jgi:hypothetical protein
MRPILTKKSLNGSKKPNSVAKSPVICALKDFPYARYCNRYIWYILGIRPLGEF